MKEKNKKLKEIILYIYDVSKVCVDGGGDSCFILSVCDDARGKRRLFTSRTALRHCC